MRKRIGIIVLSLAVAMGAMALPAKPGPVVITEEDGTEQIVFLHGDEFFHYMTTQDGRWMEMQNGKLAEVPALSDEEVVARREARRKALLSSRVIEATTQAVPLNLAPRGLVILTQFSDLSFKEANNLAAYKSMFESDKYSYNGATGSAKQYFIDQSFGQYSPRFDIVGPVTISKTQSYYGSNDRWGDDAHPDEMIIEACQIADTVWDVDFSIYDNDHDGFIDFVYVIYAGRGEADGGPAYSIWPHTSYIYSARGKTIRLDGRVLDTYACSNELRANLWGSSSRDGIGSFCHEFSHVLGLPDHYATNYISTKQTGDWDLMCSGNYNNNSNTPASYTAFERFFLGWAEPVILNEPVTIDSMKPIATSGESYIITETGEHNFVGNDPKPTFFYMLENREKVSWDAYIPGEGLMVTKIDFSYNKWVSNIVNNNASSRGYEIIEADGKEPKITETGGEGKQGDVFPAGEVNSFSPFEKYPISAIKRNDDGTIHFNFMGGDDHVSELAKKTASALYGEGYTEIVAVYDAAGNKVHSEGILNDLPSGLYIVAVSNGEKQKGVKIYIK